MCYFCAQYEKSKLTTKEAMNAIGELLQNETDQEKINHLLEVTNGILDKETPFDEWDTDDDTGSLDELDQYPGID